MVWFRRGSSVVVLATATNPADPSLILTLAETQARRLPPGESDASAAGGIAGSNTARALGELAGSLSALAAVLIVWRESRERRADLKRRRHHPSLGQVQRHQVVDVSTASQGLRDRTRALFALEAALMIATGIAVLYAALPETRASHPGVAVAIVATAGVGALGVARYRRTRGRLARSARRQPTARSVFAFVLALPLALSGVGFLFLALNWAASDPGEVELEFGFSERWYLSLPFAIVGLLLLAIAVLPWRLAVRLCRTLPPKEVLRDGRAPILYLRAFEDDRLRIAVAPWARDSLLERAAGATRLGFEEIVAGELQLYAPVTAVSEPRRWLAPIGLVRESLDPETWRAEVHGRIARAGIITVVLGRGDGLTWELTTLLSTGAWRRSLVVIPPVDRDELRERWDRLASLLRAAGFVGVNLPHEPPVLLAMTLTPAGECRFYTATTGTTWSYKAAVAQALSDLTQGALTRPGRPRRRMADLLPGDRSTTSGPGPGRRSRMRPPCRRRRS